jgi:hypothetical protein
LDVGKDIAYACLLHQYADGALVDGQKQSTGKVELQKRGMVFSVVEITRQCLQL